jgi:hypothetical protein
VSLSRVLCGAGAEVLPLSSSFSSSSAADDVAAPEAAAAAAQLRQRLPLRVRSAKGYKTVLSTHGAAAGAWHCEVSLPRMGPSGAARLGWAPDAAPLGGPVGAAAAAPADAGAGAAAACMLAATARDAAAGVGVRGATGQALRAGRAPSAPVGPTFGEGDVVRGPCTHTHTQKRIAKPQNDARCFFGVLIVLSLCAGGAVSVHAAQRRAVRRR